MSAHERLRELIDTANAICATAIELPLTEARRLVDEYDEALPTPGGQP